MSEVNKQAILETINKKLNDLAAKTNNEIYELIQTHNLDCIWIDVIRLDGKRQSEITLRCCADYNKIS